MKTDKIFYQGFLLMLLVQGAVWFKSGSTKLIEGKFPGILAPILEKFASNNPYPFYKDFLEKTAIPNTQLIGTLVMWGEFFTSLAILIGGVYLLFRITNRFLMTVFALGLLGGMFLNLNFWLAAGWTGATKESLNLIMLGVELIGFIVIIKALGNEKN